MGLQHEGAHARVFRGVDVERKHVQLRKREIDYNDNVHRFIHVASHNTNHDNIKMNVPAGFEASATTSADGGKSTLALQNKAQDDDSDVVETVYSVVYQTMSQTFEGTPAGYVTETAATTPTNIAQSGASTTAASAAASSTGNADEAAYESMKSAAQATASASSSSSSNAYPTRQMLPNASSSAISASTDVSDATAAIAGSATNAAVGANAVGGSPIAATRTPDESNSGMTGGAKAGLAFGLIIGLGLLAGLAFFCYRRRKNPKQHEEINEKFNEKSGFPVTQSNRFSADSDKSSLRSSNTPATAPRLSLRPVTQFLPNLTNQNKDLSVANTPMNEKASAWERRPQNSAQNPFGDAAVMSEKQSNPFDEGDGHDRNNSMSSTGSAETNPNVGTAAAVPVPRGPNNVHRVQLDFKPSMEDELELISGQLVRMLHEYDDGWALCIRMDRTQQGVVPRTCLSKLPVKPRGPPQGRPQGPPSNGMPSPPSGHDAMAPRPLTSTSTRSRSGTMEAVPARKPVPGQAL